MLRRIQSDGDIAEGLGELVRVEPRFTHLMAQAGTIPLRRAEPDFAGLCRAIVGQQVSVASARAIWTRVASRYPSLDHHDILVATEQELRACGLSGPKIRTLHAISMAVDKGLLDFGALETLDPADVHARMTAISGIGPWTADIFLMFHLGHADVFAPGDLALQEALRIGFELQARPTAKELAAIAAQWSPWRAVAARLLWAYYAKVKTRDGINL